MKTQDNNVSTQFIEDYERWRRKLDYAREVVIAADTPEKRAAAEAYLRLIKEEVNWL